ncbi:hypothetical protein BC830DRAFT_1119367 [Chytriomyces sp. MP71]|nr:hypothetical protein BC830DRAFT_1119367 [Chytriomyces sp. MP71]
MIISLRHHRSLRVCFSLISVVIVFALCLHQRLLTLQPEERHVQKVSPTTKLRAINFDDRISHITMKLAADHYVPGPGVNIPQGFERRMGKLRLPLTADIASTVVKDGAVIYVDANALRVFVTNYLAKIRVRFVLVSGDTDLCIPNCMFDENPDLLTRLLTAPTLLHWYTTNCNGTLLHPTHISCMPIGLEQHNKALETMQVAYVEGFGLANGLEPLNRPWETDDGKQVLISFRIGTNVPGRLPPWNFFCSRNESILSSLSLNTLSVRTVANCFFDKKLARYRFYKYALSQSHFVLSPAGQGLDAYRTYEALLLGAYPIVITSELDVLFKDLPVLILEAWEDLSLEILRKTYADFQAKTWDYSSLYVSYWAAKWQSHA